MRSSAGASFCIAVLLASGCGDQGDCCEATEPTVDGYSDFALTTNADGFVLVYGVAASSDNADRSGLWARHPGEGAVHVMAGVDAQSVAAVETELGVLACWWSSRCGIDESPDHGCGVLGDDLRFVEPPVREPYGWVEGFLEIDGRRYALSQPECGDGGIQLTAIAEDGQPAAATVPLPCRSHRPEQIAASGDRLVCLVSSDPLCGDQFDEPPGCRTMLQRFDVLGEPIGAALDVGPFGDYSYPIDVNVAARDDGFLVTWFEAGALHARAVTADFTPGAESALSRTDATRGGSSLSPTPSGYVATWAPGSYPSDLEAVWFAADGTRTSESVPVAENSSLPDARADIVSVAILGVRAAAAWLAANVETGADNRIGILFREIDP